MGHLQSDTIYSPPASVMSWCMTKVSEAPEGITKMEGGWRHGEPSDLMQYRGIAPLNTGWRLCALLTRSGIKRSSERSRSERDVLHIVINYESVTPDEAQNGLFWIQTESSERPSVSWLRMMSPEPK